MNWLAHLRLSEPSPAFRIGSLLPDLIPAPLLAGLPAEFQGGIGRHRQIDAFTDAHALFRRSVQRLRPPYRRFGGILVDVFYDHFLSRDWRYYSNTSLPGFVAECHAAFESLGTDLPAEAASHLQRIRRGNWLNSYGEIAGVAEALRRTGSRLRRPFDLGASVSVLEENYEAFHGDFAAFFPELIDQVTRSATTRASDAKILRHS